MSRRFPEITFGDSVKQVQEEQGSRRMGENLENQPFDDNTLTPREQQFIGSLDHFYMASTAESGWPYVQFRGGPMGFLKVLDERTLAFADFRGNRQYVSLGNLKKDDRVALFFMDYANQTRLKLLGRVRVVGSQESNLLKDLELGEYRARVERGFAIRVEAFDWNCPQHITPRYTEAQVRELMAPILEENRALKSRGGNQPD